MDWFPTPTENVQSPWALEQNQLADCVSLCLLCIVLSSCPSASRLYVLSPSLSLPFLPDLVALSHLSTTLSSPLPSLPPSASALSLPPHPLPPLPLPCLLFWTEDLPSSLSPLLSTTPTSFISSPHPCLPAFSPQAWIHSPLHLPRAAHLTVAEAEAVAVAVVEAVVVAEGVLEPLGPPCPAPPVVASSASLTTCLDTG